MVRAIKVSIEAEQEASHAWTWYENKEPGLGGRFMQAVEESISAAATNPEIYPFRLGRFRRIGVRKFPYSVYFENDETSISVQSVFHESQHPSRLDRLRETES